MAKTAIGFGIALILLGLYGYLSVPNIERSKTALIPAIAGAVLVICGIAAMNPAMKKHAMHGAAVVGVLGFLAPLGRIIPQSMKGNPPSGLAGFSQITMSALCLLFVILCVRSFISARKARQTG